MPNYSICIPAYKSRFLSECIQSVLNQTFGDFELIVLNDHSPEPIGELVAAFTDARIRYVANDVNVGAIHLTDNWNKCLSMARGEYVIMMGDDDRMAADYLEEFNRLIDQYPGLNVYHCRSMVIDDRGQPVQLTPAQPSFERVCDHIWHRLNQWRSQYISDFVYRTSALRRNGGYYPLPLAWGSDDITAYLACADTGIAHTNRPVFQYRTNPLSITSSGNDLEKMRANMHYGKWLREFLTRHVPHPSEQVVYDTLVRQQEQLMLRRKRYTMTLSMRTRRLAGFWMWYRYRKVFGIRLMDIIASVVKSRNLHKHLLS